MLLFHDIYMASGWTSAEQKEVATMRNHAKKNINPEKQKCSRLLFCCIFFL